MIEFLRKNQRVVFYSLWLLLGIVQASLTELQDDEAYYWVYSRYPDWGYFDHPPLIALLIKIGFAIFPNELGVRLFPVFLSLLLIIILEKLAGRKNQSLFFSMVLSMAVFQLLGFLAVPDIPLLFFTALFLYRYKYFLEKPSLLNSAWLGLVAALLLYSKYHAILLFIFLVISNPGLLRRYQFYFAAAISLLLFLPHLWWQYEHDWVSIKYHLFESNVNKYRISHSLEYLGGQLLLPGPIIGFLLLPAAFMYKHKSLFEKGLKYIMTGIYLFFLLSSFRGKVELNWTSPALIPLFLLSYNYLNEKNTWKNILYRVVPASLLILVFARIVMIVDLVPLKTVQKKFHSWNKWPEIMKEKTGNRNVVFSNSYQRASKYWFYTGIPAYSLNLYKERRNNFNYWPLEDSLLGRPVYFLDTYDMFKYSDSLRTGMGWIGYRFDSSFASFAKVQIKLPDKKYRVKTGEHLELDCRLEIPEHYKTFVAQHPGLGDTTVVGVFDKNGWVKDIHTPLRINQAIISPEHKLYLAVDLPPGKYYLLFAISQGKYFGTHNSDRIELLIE